MDKPFVVKSEPEELIAIKDEPEEVTEEISSFEFINCNTAFPVRDCVTNTEIKEEKKDEHHVMQESSTLISNQSTSTCKSVGKYKRKTTRQSWDANAMQQAITAIQKRKMGWLAAAKTFNVPSTTLRRRCKKNMGCEKGYLGGRKNTFSREVEAEMLAHIKSLEEMCFKLTTIDVRKLAYEIAEKNGIWNNFSKSEKIAGLDWLKGFRSRNPTISLHTPESTSAARALAFNKVTVGKYFENLRAVLEKHKIQPSQLWNVDQAVLTTVPAKSTKIIGRNGKKQIGILSIGDQSHHLTVVCAMSAMGNFVPPGFIFPLQQLESELMDNAPLGSVAFAEDGGWMSTEIFHQWLQHFVNYVKPSQDDKVLLIVDGHGSHKTLEAITYAKQHGIVLFCLPPNCSQCLQPLDLSFYGPLSTYYNTELKKRLKSCPGGLVTHHQIVEIFNYAYLDAATISAAESGFRQSGIHPFNPEIFSESLHTAFGPTNTEITEVNERENPSSFSVLKECTTTSITNSNQSTSNSSSVVKES